MIGPLSFNFFIFIFKIYTLNGVLRNYFPLARAVSQIPVNVHAHVDLFPRVRHAFALCKVISYPQLRSNYAANSQQLVPGCIALNLCFIIDTVLIQTVSILKQKFRAVHPGTGFLRIGYSIPQAINTNQRAHSWKESIQ